MDCLALALELGMSSESRVLESCPGWWLEVQRKINVYIHQKCINLKVMAQLDWKGFFFDLTSQLVMSPITKGSRLSSWNVRVVIRIFTVLIIKHQ